MNNLNTANDETVSATIKLGEFCDKCGLQILLGNPDDDITFKSVLINRPGLLLAGFEDYFGNSRVQVIGNAEYYYLATLQDADKEKALRRLFVQRIPCVIYSRAIRPSQLEIDIAAIYGIPILMSEMTTTWLLCWISTESECS